MFEHRFIDDVAWLTASGGIDFDSWRAALESLVTAEGFRRGMPILFDARATSAIPPPGISAQVVDTWRIVAGSSTVALVVPDGAAFGIARQVAIRSNGQIEAFTELPEALRFLNRSRPRT
jgi:hypothetical protein